MEYTLQTRRPHSCTKQPSEPFAGYSAVSLSYWLRRYIDFSDAQDTPFSDEVRAMKIKFFPSGSACDKYDKLPEADRKYLAKVAKQLKDWFVSTKIAFSS